MKIKTLIVEDHPAMVEGYRSILSSMEKYTFEHKIASNCETAHNIIFEEKNNHDLFLLDVLIPSYEKYNLKSGEDIAKMIRARIPNAKIVILTSHVESILLYSIYSSIKPNGFLVKSDFNPDELVIAIEKILNGENYYTTSVKRSVQEMSKAKLFLDKYNRQIISLISSGVKTKNLPQLLKLSLSSIDKRKVQIKDFLGIDKGGDEDIINEARKQGLI